MVKNSAALALPAAMTKPAAVTVAMRVFSYLFSSPLEIKTLCKGYIKTGATLHRLNHNINFTNAAIYRVSRTNVHLFIKSLISVAQVSFGTIVRFIEVIQ